MQVTKYNNNNKTDVSANVLCRLADVWLSTTRTSRKGKTQKNINKKKNQKCWNWKWVVKMENLLKISLWDCENVTLSATTRPADECEFVGKTFTIRKKEIKNGKSVKSNYLFFRKYTAHTSHNGRPFTHLIASESRIALDALAFQRACVCVVCAKSDRASHEMSNLSPVFGPMIQNMRARSTDSRMHFAACTWGDNYSHSRTSRLFIYFFLSVVFCFHLSFVFWNTTNSIREWNVNQMNRNVGKISSVSAKPTNSTLCHMKIIKANGRFACTHFSLWILLLFVVVAFRFCMLAADARWNAFFFFFVATLCVLDRIARARTRGMEEGGVGSQQTHARMFGDNQFNWRALMMCLMRAMRLICLCASYFLIVMHSDGTLSGLHLFAFGMWNVND